jgi:G6PDH family F420-dependent oxidoreductase
MPKLDIQLDIGENEYDPQEFVDAVHYAEGQEFKTAWLGDHFVPWYHSGKRSAFVWSVLGVALERTHRIKIGPLVTTPMGARYHPAIVAQASATLDNMYPGRFLLGVGAGEALNETPFWNDKWPKWEERMERLVEGIRLIRKLWEAKRPFKFSGKYFPASFYFLYTKPRRKVPIYFSAIGKRGAYNAGKYADYLVTMSPRNTVEKLEKEILPAFRQGMKDAHRNSGGIVIHTNFSFDKPTEIIRKSWRTLGWLLKDSWSIENPVAVEKAGRKVTVEDVKRGTNLVNGWNDLIKIIEGYKELGANAVVIISGADKKRIRELAQNVLKVF